MRLEIFITSRMSCSTSTTRDPLRGDLLDHRVDLRGLDRVAAGRRLVEQQHLRLGRQRARDLQPLERAIGQGACPPVGDARASRPARAVPRPARACRRFCATTDGSMHRVRQHDCGAHADGGRPSHSRSRSCERKSAGSETCATSPRARADAPACAVTSSSSRCTRPRFGAIEPEMRLNSVVLPAPFGPMIAKISAVLDRERHAVDARARRRSRCQIFARRARS